MNKFTLPALLLTLNVTVLPSIQADTIHTGSLTVTWTPTGAVTVNTAPGSPNLLRFSHETLSGATDTPNTYTIATGSLTANFQADEGLIFDKMYFGGISGGATFLEAGGAHSYMGWDVHGGSFTGPATYGGTNNPDEGYYREWEITGPTTGRSTFGDSWWYRSRIFDFNDPVYGGGYYDIGAASFSMDFSAYVGIFHVGGPWPTGIIPQSINFGFTYLDAPPADPAVPETAPTLGLMALGLAGLAGVRRKVSRT